MQLNKITIVFIKNTPLGFFSSINKALQAIDCNERISYSSVRRQLSKFNEFTQVVTLNKLGDSEVTERAMIRMHQVPLNAFIDNGIHYLTDDEVQVMPDLHTLLSNQTLFL